MDSELGIHGKLNRYYTYTRAVSVKRYRLIYWKNHIVNEEIESGKDGELYIAKSYK